MQGGLELTPTGDAPGWKPPAAAATSATDPAAAGQVVPVSVYDPLIDEYEPGARTPSWPFYSRSCAASLSPMVSAITAGIRHRAARHSPVRSTAASQGPVGEAVLKRFYPRERQKVFGEGVAAAIGFDFTRGRLDVTAHPFCSGIGPGDCRITTRYDEHHFSEAFSGILHEAGHGLYEQGLDPAHYGTPMGEAVSLGVHESQSRLWENAVGRGRPFWTYWFPLARSDLSRGLGRRDARRLPCGRQPRRALLDPGSRRRGHLQPAHHRPLRARAGSPEREPAGRRPSRGLERRSTSETLGVTPPNDAEGCLQDIHWSAGLFGYFPTYTLGNLYAAQLFAKAQTDLGGLDEAFARGDFRGLLEWPRANVHRHGQRYRPAALIERITGTKPDHRPLIDALRQKYGELYGI